MSIDLQNCSRVFPVVEVGIEAVLASTTRTFARHFHDQFGIGVILTGAQRSASGRGPVEAICGDVITVNPGEVHDGAPIDGEARTWAMLYIDPDTVARIALDLSEGRTSDLQLEHPVRTDPALARMFLRLFHSLSNDRGSREDFGTEQLMLLLERSALQGARLERNGGASHGFRRARQAIDDDPFARHRLDRLASIAGMGPFRLIRAFSAETGMTPHAYAMQRRLQAARRLLRQGLSPAQASAEAGFADQSHLTRLFARSYGMTPATYARAGR
ncbi:hypothetical protein ASG43_04325 [Aureimonas sp. Leaf454]|uniref:AraC family transcriptional regulator n=1 Tax=Aureimonas sp. Leaf454 TaxID=1736381 RepID=UPI0006FC47D6|nr:AraC family transcriptional regulator [Aureimonas sp. Leaf454]KQT54791.1 hypothetical protein ASG43_04325 [Aureimonas sp. Leaf454]